MGRRSVDGEGSDGMELRRDMRFLGLRGVIVELGKGMDVMKGFFVIELCAAVRVDVAMARLRKPSHSICYAYASQCILHCSTSISISISTSHWPWLSLRLRAFLKSSALLR